MDLSPRMLARARRLGLYDALEERDLIEHLSKVEAGSLDLVAALDVFGYLGDLDAVFAEVRRGLRAPGFFAFTVERAADGVADFALTTSGRYHHAARYIEALCRAHAWQRLLAADAVLRTERDQPITSAVIVLAPGAA